MSILGKDVLKCSYMSFDEYSFKDGVCGTAIIPQQSFLKTSFTFYKSGTTEEAVYFLGVSLTSVL